MAVFWNTKLMDVTVTAPSNFVMLVLYGSHHDGIEMERNRATNFLGTDL